MSVWVCGLVHECVGELLDAWVPVVYVCACLGGLYEMLFLNLLYQEQTQDYASE